MENGNGFFGLKTANDLFKKLKEDYQHLKDSPWDSRRAFNFFVTAGHLPNWIFKTEKEKQSFLLKDSIPRVCLNLANGAKHFNKGRENKTFKRTYRSYVYAEDVFEEGIFDDPLIVELTDAEARRFGSPQIDVLSLAGKVMKFWEAHSHLLSDK